MVEHERVYRYANAVVCNSNDLTNELINLFNCFLLRWRFDVLFCCCRRCSCLFIYLFSVLFLCLSLSRIGLCGFDNPMRDPKTDELKRHVGQVNYAVEKFKPD